MRFMTIVEAAIDGLVCEAGKQVAIADDKLTPGSARKDSLFPAHSRARCDQRRRALPSSWEELSPRLPGSSEQDAHGSVRGLPGGCVLLTLAGQPLGEELQLRGGPGPVEPFQNNEASKYSLFHRATIVMRTALLVIAVLIFPPAFPGYPQESAASARGVMDQEITVTGGDEPPFPFLRREPGPLLVPDVDPQNLHFFALPCLTASGVWAAPPAEWRVKDPLSSGLKP